MSIGRQVVSSMRWMLSAKFAAQAITWAITILVVRILSPSDYGLMAMATVPIGFLALLDEMGMGSALVQRRSITGHQIESVFGLLVLVHLALYAVVYAAAPLVALYFDEPRVTLLVRVLAIRIPILSFAVVPESILRRAMRFRAISVISFASATVDGVFTLTLALSGAGVWSLVGGALLGGAVRAVAMAVAAGRWIRPRWDLAAIRGMLGFGTLVTFNRLLWYLYSQADVLIIGRFLGKELLGFYAIAMHVATLPMSKIAGIMNEVGFAAFSRVQEEREMVRAHFRRAARMVAMFAFPVFLGISSVSPEIVGVLLGPKWAPVTVPLAALSLVVPLRMLATMIAPTLIGLGRPGVSTVNQVIACIIVPTAIMLALPGGLDAIAFSWLVSFPLYFAIVLIRSLPVVGVKIGEYARDVAPPALAGGIMLATVATIRILPGFGDVAAPLRGIVLVAAGAAAYTSIAWIFARDRVREVLATIRM